MKFFLELLLQVLVVFMRLDCIRALRTYPPNVGGHGMEEELEFVLTIICFECGQEDIELDMTKDKFFRSLDSAGK